MFHHSGKKAGTIKAVPLGSPNVFSKFVYWPYFC